MFFFLHYMYLINVVTLQIQIINTKYYYYEEFLVSHLQNSIIDPSRSKIQIIACTLASWQQYKGIDSPQNRTIFKHRSTAPARTQLFFND